MYCCNQTVAWYLNVPRETCSFKLILPLLYGIVVENMAKNTKVVGNLGEEVALEYLLRQGYTCNARNYWQKWGEIDLIMEKQGVTYFIEVKSVSYETREKLRAAVTHETWRPEELVHERKLHQIEKALQTWIEQNAYEGEWRIGVMAVRLVPRETYAAAEYIEVAA